MNKIKILSPAKINLDLIVLNKRNDNYHNITSLMQPISLYDEIEIGVSDSKNVLNLQFPNEIAGFEENLITKAALKFIDYFSITSHLNISVKKRIPVAAGMGGGSSNAASTLIALSKLFSIDNFDALKGIAIDLGSDVPFFLYSRTARVGGRGEIVEPYNMNEKLKYLLIFPNIISETKLIYSLLDENYDSLKSEIIKPYLKKPAFLNGKDFILENTFTPFLIEQNEKYLDIFKILENLDFDAYSISGTGSTIFCVLDSKKNYSESIKYLESNEDFSTMVAESFEGWHFSFD
jgi:4-diphosphocytidyl-2-C-methyl-D-erythritol kinase